MAVAVKEVDEALAASEAADMEKAEAEAAS